MGRRGIVKVLEERWELEKWEGRWEGDRLGGDLAGGDILGLLKGDGECSSSSRQRSAMVQWRRWRKGALGGWPWSRSKFLRFVLVLVSGLGRGSGGTGGCWCACWWACFCCASSCCIWARQMFFWARRNFSTSILMARCLANWRKVRAPAYCWRRKPRSKREWPWQMLISDLIMVSSSASPSRNGHCLSLEWQFSLSHRTSSSLFRTPTIFSRMPNPPYFSRNCPAIPTNSRSTTRIQSSSDFFRRWNFKEELGTCARKKNAVGVSSITMMRGECGMGQIERWMKGLVSSCSVFSRRWKPKLSCVMLLCTSFCPPRVISIHSPLKVEGIANWLLPITRNKYKSPSPPLRLKPIHALHVLLLSPPLCECTPKSCLFRPASASAKM